MFKISCLNLKIIYQSDFISQDSARMLMLATSVFQCICYSYCELQHPYDMILYHIGSLDLFSLSDSLVRVVWQENKEFSSVVFIILGHVCPFLIEAPCCISHFDFGEYMNNTSTLYKTYRKTFQASEQAFLGTSYVV